MTYDKPRSHIVRDAKRAALRDRMTGSRTSDGKHVSGLTTAELDAALRQLGLDPDAIGATALVNANMAAGMAQAAQAANTEATTAELAAAIAAEPDAIAPDAIEAEVQKIRELVMTMGLNALDDRLRELVLAANKPPVEVRVEVPVIPANGAPVHVAKPTGTSATWRKLFGVPGTLGDRTTTLWDGSHPDTPRGNDRYVWPHPQTETALTQIARGNPVLMFGPPGTGKTDFAQQLAARTGRPFILICCDDGTDAATLVGMTVPEAGGGTKWQDGQLTRAVRTPGAIICIDELSLARPGALFVVNNLLAHKVLYIAETGERVPLAPGAVVLATDNTNGTGGGGRKGFTGTNRLNAAFLDKFGARVRFEYMPFDQEVSVLCAYAGCTEELARLLVQAATVTRAAADTETVSAGIGLRRLVAWAQLLTDGIDAETAFKAAVLDAAPEQDVEAIREQCLLAYDKAAVERALRGTVAPPDPAEANPSPAGRAAAAEFPPA